MRIGMFAISSFVCAGQGSCAANPKKRSVKLPISFFKWTRENYKKPEGAFTGVYGAVNLRSLLVRQTPYHIDNDLFPQTFTVEISGLKGVEDQHDLTTVGDADGIILSRAKFDLILRVRECWESILKRAKVGEAERQLESDFPRYGTSYPHLIGRLRKFDDFKHLKLIVFPVKFAGVNVPVASYFEPETIRESEIKSTDLNITI